MISFFQKGKSVLEGLSFLHLSKKYDICTERNSDSTCAFGKVYVFLLRLRTEYLEIWKLTMMLAENQ